MNEIGEELEIKGPISSGEAVALGKAAIRIKPQQKKCKVICLRGPIAERLDLSKAVFNRSGELVKSPTIDHHLSGEAAKALGKRFRDAGIETRVYQYLDTDNSAGAYVQYHDKSDVPKVREVVKQVIEENQSRAHTKPLD